MCTNGQIVEVRQEEENAEKREKTQEYGAHGALATCLLVHLASTVPSKSRNTQETTTDEVGHAKRDKLSVGAQLHSLNCLNTTKTLGSNGRFEEPEKSNEERAGHGRTNMGHQRRLEGPLEAEQSSASRLDLAKNLYSLLVPFVVPAKDC